MIATAFSNFFSQDIIELNNRYEVNSTLSRGGHYFPTSNLASDILQALLKWVNELNVEVRSGHQIEKLIVENNVLQGL